MNSESPRDRLLAAALRLLADEGPDALQARRVAAEIGASTMAVYTHFGGMGQLVEAVAVQGFVEFGAGLAAVPPHDDSLVHLFSIALAYRDFALNNANLYRLMFGLSPGKSPAAVDFTAGQMGAAGPEGAAAFGHLLDGVTRVMASGRIHQGDPMSAALQLWSAMHGYVLLEIAGFFGPDGDGIELVLVPLARNILIGMGDTAPPSLESIRAVLATVRAT
ncbi:TetR-like C-terminal domain-containing protein [Jatrophihabitans sp. GAS493]|uniref:TetR-like C-terminal domain-containing protein n=1 Tax=Jatrophihabitans sp. GAS493 TaxID=1907575 RepID=UPI001561268E|nr:TetR-like C-terminal domain-containing protein [Jatrophihabitans sp. GAS493]